jgi:hypothetical protein
MAKSTMSVENIANEIKKLNKKQIEELAILISNNNSELISRKDDILQKKVKTLSRDEIFNV